MVVWWCCTSCCSKEVLPVVLRGSNTNQPAHDNVGQTKPNKNTVASHKFFISARLMVPLLAMKATTPCRRTSTSPLLGWPQRWPTEPFCQVQLDFLLLFSTSNPWPSKPSESFKEKNPNQNTPQNDGVWDTAELVSSTSLLCSRPSCRAAIEQALWKEVKLSVS